MHRPLPRRAVAALLAALTVGACGNEPTGPETFRPVNVTLDYPRMATIPVTFEARAAGGAVVVQYTRGLGCGTQLSASGAYTDDALELTVVETSVPFDGACLAALVSTTVRLTATPAAAGRYTVRVRNLLPIPGARTREFEVGRATVTLP